MIKLNAINGAAIRSPTAKISAVTLIKRSNATAVTVYVPNGENSKLRANAANMSWCTPIPKNNTPANAVIKAGKGSCAGTGTSKPGGEFNPISLAINRPPSAVIESAARTTNPIAKPSNTSLTAAIANRIPSASRNATGNGTTPTSKNANIMLSATRIRTGNVPPPGVGNAAITPNERKPIKAHAINQRSMALSLRVNCLN